MIIATAMGIDWSNMEYSITSVTVSAAKTKTQSVSGPALIYSPSASSITINGTPAPTKTWVGIPNNVSASLSFYNNNAKGGSSKTFYIYTYN